MSSGGRERERKKGFKRGAPFSFGYPNIPVLMQQKA